MQGINRTNYLTPAQQPPAAQGPITTIVPFNDAGILPNCAKACGPLYDANGGCVPPAIQAGPLTNYQACFCANPKVSAMSTSPEQVCDNACQGNELSSVGNWFSSICNIKERPNNPKTTTSTQGSSGSSGSSGGSSNGNGGDWMSNHWKWVVMLVVLVVGIAAIWIGACIWRRRYLKRKDRQSTFGQKHSGSIQHPSWGPPLGSTPAAPEMAYAQRRNDMPTFNSAEDNRKPKGKKKWTVSERT